MANADLYFMLNPALGIIKIGISDDVDARRRTLEHGCGVSLEVLRVVSGGCGYERELHWAFRSTRLIGEWFAPSPELLVLVDGPEKIPSFLERMRPQIQQWQAEADAENIRRKEEAKEAARVERERIAELKKEQKRIERERQARLAKARAAREEKRLQQVEAERAAWASRHPDLKSRLVRNDLERQAWDRRASIENQRGRNAALIGVAPEGA